MASENATQTPSIELIDLNFGYKALDGPEKPVLFGVDLTLPPGSRCILVGANGAGQSNTIWAQRWVYTRSCKRVMGLWGFRIERS